MARINTNIPSVVAQANLSRTQKELGLRLERLSTGLRINRGKDDPAGLIISERVRSDIASGPVPSARSLIWRRSGQRSRRPGIAIYVRHPRAAVQSRRIRGPVAGPGFGSLGNGALPGTQSATMRLQAFVAIEKWRYSDKRSDGGERRVVRDR